MLQRIIIEIGWKERLIWVNTRTALIIIIRLLVAIDATMIKASRVERLAAWLLAPYLLWVAYATTINVGVVAMN
jgi:tryptophan-rich sensory protein